MLFLLHGIAGEKFVLLRKAQNVYRETCHSLSQIQPILHGFNSSQLALLKQNQMTSDR